MKSYLVNVIALFALNVKLLCCDVVASEIVKLVMTQSSLIDFNSIPWSVAVITWQCGNLIPCVKLYRLSADKHYFVFHHYLYVFSDF